MPGLSEHIRLQFPGGLNTNCVRTTERSILSHLRGAKCHEDTFFFFYALFNGNTQINKPHQCDNCTLSSELSSTEQCPDKTVNLLLLRIVLIVVRWNL